MVSTSFNSLSHVQSSGILQIAANFNHICLFQHFLLYISGFSRKIASQNKREKYILGPKELSPKGFFFSCFNLIVCACFLFWCPLIEVTKASSGYFCSGRWDAASWRGHWVCVGSGVWVGLPRLLRMEATVTMDGRKKFRPYVDLFTLAYSLLGIFHSAKTLDVLYASVCMFSTEFFQKKAL